MTWGEFKEWVEAEGVEDDTEINTIDIRGFAFSAETPEIHDEDDDSVSIY